MTDINKFLDLLFEREEIQKDFNKYEYLLDTNVYNEFKDCIKNNLEDYNYASEMFGEYEICTYHLEDYGNNYVDFIMVLLNDKVLYAEMNVKDDYNINSNINWVCFYSNTLYLNRCNNVVSYFLMFNNSGYNFIVGRWV